MTDLEFDAKMKYFFGVREALGFETVWSMYEFDSIDQNILKEGKKILFYKFFSNDATVDELMNGTAQEIAVSAVAESGSVKDLWTAAEACFQKAKSLGDWHKYIEDLVMQEDGSFELVMGS